MRSRRLASPESGALVSSASNGIAQATRAVVSTATRPFLGAAGSTLTSSAFGGYGTTAYPPTSSATNWGSFGYWDSSGCYYSPYSSWWGWSFGWSSGWGFYAGWNWNSPYCYSPYGYGSYYPYYGYSPYSWYYPTVVNHYIYEDDDDYDQVTVNVYGGGQVGEGVYADGAGVAVDVYPDPVAAAPATTSGGAVQAPAAGQLSAAGMRYLELGDTAFSELRFADAVHFYARAIEFDPDRGMLHLVLADALFATADYHYAAFSIRKALQLEPELVAAPVDKHQFYADPLEFDRQLAALELFYETHPSDADARLVLALNQLFGGRPEAAMKLLESAPTQVYGGTDQASAAILQSAKLARWGASPPTEAKW